MTCFLGLSRHIAALTVVLVPLVGILLQGCGTPKAVTFQDKYHQVLAMAESHQAIEANKKATAVEKWLSSYQGTDIQQHKTKVAIMQAILFGLETQYATMDKRMQALEKDLSDASKTSAHFAAECYLDMAQGYLQFGYGAHAARYARMAQARAKINPSSIDGIRLALVKAQSQLIAAQPRTALKELAPARIWIDSLPSLPSEKPLLQELKTRILLTELQAYIDAGDVATAEKAWPAAEQYLVKTYKKKDHFLHDLWLHKAEYLKLKGDADAALKAYTKALSIKGGYLGYPKKSQPTLRTETKLALLYFDQDQHTKGLNHAQKVKKLVDGRFNMVPEYDAIKYMVLSREACAAPETDRLAAWEYMKEVPKLSFGAYQINPSIETEVYRAYYQLALQLDSVAAAERIEKKLKELALVAAGKNSARYKQETLIATYQHAINSGHWPAVIDTFGRYYDSTALAQYMVAAPQRIQLQNMYARALEETDQLKAAKIMWQETQQALVKTVGEKSLLVAGQTEQLAGVEISLGNYAVAEELLNQALTTAAKPAYRTTPIYAAAMRKLLRIYLIYDEFSWADEVSEILVNSTFKPYFGNMVYTEANTDLAPVLAYLRGKYLEAEDGFLAQLTEADKLGDRGRAQKIQPLNWLGQTYLELGDYPAAEESAREAMGYALALYGDSSRKYYECLQVLQRMYRLMGHSEKSMQLATQILSKEKRVYGPEHLAVAEAGTELALASYLYNDSLPTVEPLLTQAQGIYKKIFGGEHLRIAEANKNLAAYYIDKGKYAEATTLLAEAIDIYKLKLGKKPVQLIDVLILKGDLMVRSGKPRDAHKWYNQAEELVKQHLDVLHPKNLSLQVHKAKGWAAEGEYKKALKHLKETTQLYLNYFSLYFPYLSEREKFIVYNQSQADFDFYKTLAAQHAKEFPAAIGDIYNLSLATKGLLMNNSQGMRSLVQASKDKKVLAAFEDWQRKREELTQLSQAQSSDDNQAKAQKLQQDIELLEKRISSSSAALAGFSTKGKGTTWQMVKSGLKPNELAIEMMRTPITDDSVHYLALVVHAESKEPQLITLRNGAFLEQKAIRFYRNAMRYQLEDSLSAGWFWNTLAQQLPAKNRIFLSAEGVYHELNLGSLRLRAGRYLADEYDVTLVGSTREVAYQLLAKGSTPKKGAKPVKTTIAKTSAVLVANPTFYTDTLNQPTRMVRGVVLQPLPGTVREVKEIDSLLVAKRWTTKVTLGKEADEPTIKGLYSPGVLHLATHGIFVESDNPMPKRGGAGLMAQVSAAENSMLSVGLVLKNGGQLLESDTNTNLNRAPGILTAYEVQNMNLNQTELVVLSACETGLGHQHNGEGVFGLQRAFQVAGAKNVIFSLFKVDDAVTATLMRQFYQYWLDGADKRTAFAKAQADVRKTHPNPAYWGSFVMLGM